MSAFVEVLGLSWAGGGDHEGHNVRPIEAWPARWTETSLTVGRVACSCGREWDVGGWPAAHAAAIYALTDPAPTEAGARDR